MASTTERGYGAEHQKERKRWAAAIALAPVQCARCPHLINQGDRWELDHTDDRTGYLGPSHWACNRRAGGLKAHEASQTVTRDW